MGVESLVGRTPGIVGDRVQSAHFGRPRGRTWRRPLRGGARRWRTRRRPAGRLHFDLLGGLFTAAEADRGQSLQQAHPTLFRMLGGRSVAQLSAQLVLRRDRQLVEFVACVAGDWPHAPEPVE